VKAQAAVTVLRSVTSCGRQSFNVNSATIYDFIRSCD
jgi:hypothetical protein